MRTKERAALRCSQQRESDTQAHPVSPEMGFPFLVWSRKLFSQQLWASYVTSGLPFSLLKTRLLLLCLYSGAARTVTVYNTPQRATNRCVRFTLEMRGLTHEMHPPPITGAVKAGAGALLLSEQEFRWGCRGSLSWAAWGGTRSS